MAKCTDPRLADKQKSVQSQNSGELHGLAPDFKGSEAVFQVDPLIVVESHILRHRLFDFGPARKFSPIQALCFQRPEKIFHCRIVIRASGAGHRRLNVVSYPWCFDKLTEFFGCCDDGDKE